MFGKLGLAAVAVTGLTVAQTIGFADGGGPPVASATQVLAARAGVETAQVSGTTCARRSSPVYGEIFVCRATAAGQPVQVILTNFDGRWIVAGR